MLFYKINHTVKLTLLELCRFGLAGQYSMHKFGWFQPQYWWKFEEMTALKNKILTK